MTYGRTSSVAHYFGRMRIDFVDPHTSTSAIADG